VTDITDLEAYVNTRGFIDFLRAAGELKPDIRIPVAGDLRPSTDSPERSILSAVTRAVRDAGLDIVHCGRIPTPALMAYALSLGVPSIMVTGSHIPFDRNGIKFNRARGEILKQDEAPVLRAVEAVRSAEYAKSPSESPFGDDGMFRDGVRALPPAVSDARDHYLRRYLDFFAPGALAGLRIAVYEHSAVGASLVGEILRALGAEVFPVGRSSEFVAIDTEALDRERLATLQTLVDDVRRRVGAIDALVSTDGDSDRPLIVDVSREGHAEFRGGDLVGLVVAEFLGADAVAVPVTATDAIDQQLGERVRVTRTRVGSPYVVSAAEAMPGERRVGWEANGGFLTFSSIVRHGRTLAPLPTRDAVLPILCVLSAAAERRAPVASLFEALPRRFGAAGLLDGVAPELGGALVQSLVPPDPVRVARHFGAERGFGKLAHVSTVDGVRLHFDSGDVVHLRQSGNAPQLRVYALAGSAQRAASIVEDALREPNGILRTLLAETRDLAFVAAVRRNIAATGELFASGRPPGVIGTVSGSAMARRFWQHVLERARPAFRARRALSFHEDLPVNQAFGLLLLWQRLRPELEAGEGALLAFVFGDGTRATPFTETDNGQKAAMTSFVRDPSAADGRLLTVAELALFHYSSVEAFLRRSGFDGMVVKWGDEIQIPTRELTGSDPRFEAADVVRFVSMQPIDEDNAKNKDWILVSESGKVTRFLPRRPLSAMRELGARGGFQVRGGELWGGVNLGSIAVSRALLDVLLEEFAGEVNDPNAKRSERPDLDPQFFTVLVLAAIDDAEAREQAYGTALAESPTLRELERHLPNVLARLRGAVERFEALHRRKLKLLALDFGDQYWGDIGQHRAIFDFYTALNATGPSGEVARALAGLPETRDANGNIIAGASHLGRASVKNSVLIDAELEEGHVESSVLIGTRARKLHAEHAFDVQSVVTDLSLAERAGSYKVVASEPLSAGPAERLAMLHTSAGPRLFRVQEDTDLKARDKNYDVPILGNPSSFRAAHELMSNEDPAAVEQRYAEHAASVLKR